MNEGRGIEEEKQIAVVVVVVVVVVVIVIVVVMSSLYSLHLNTILSSTFKHSITFFYYPTSAWEKEGNKYSVTSLLFPV